MLTKETIEKHKLEFVEPGVYNHTGIRSVRVRLQNPRGDLRPDMVYIEGRVSSYWASFEIPALLLSALSYEEAVRFISKQLANKIADMIVDEMIIN